MAYNPNFLSGAFVSLPLVDQALHPHLVTTTGRGRKTRLDYPHHSVVLNKDRRLAVYSACNIDGAFIPQGSIPRRGSFTENREIPSETQLGDAFYDQCGHIIDKGHLTKYEDVIWGEDLSEEELVELGKSTNYYPNAVPQHRRLNRGKWKSLELYILDSETDRHELRICMFTGPLLDPQDPYFIHPVGDASVQLPLHFWEIVVYKKSDTLYALGFMMSHRTLLEGTGLVRAPRVRAAPRKAVFFNDFKHSKPYQVRVEVIEQWAGITLRANKPLVRPYQEDRPLEVLSRQIDVRRVGAVPTQRLLSPYRFTNLVTG